MNRTGSVWEIHHGKGNEEKKTKWKTCLMKNDTTKKSQEMSWVSVLRKGNKRISLYFYAFRFVWPARRFNRWGTH